MPLQVAEKPNPGRRWKLVLRVIAIVVSLSGVGCVAYLLYQLRRWKIDHPDGDYQADEFILAWLVFTLTLSALISTTHIFTTLRPSVHPVLPPTATLATDILFALSLLASAIWLCLAANTSIDGNTALDINFYQDSPEGYYSSPDYVQALYTRSAIEVVGIALVFLASTLHIAHARLPYRHRHPHRIRHKIADLDADASESHLPLHPAYRPPLRFPNPHHPNCAYPAPVARFQHQASPSGVHERALSTLSWQCIGTSGGGVSTETLDGKARVC